MSVSENGAGHMARVRMQRIVLLASAIFASAAVLMVAASVASAAPVGIYLAGEASEEKAKQPRFEAESYPATLGGGSTSIHKYTFQMGTYQCAEMWFSGKLSATTADLSLFQSYAFFSCTLGGWVSTISQNGCEFVWHADNAGPPYTGTVEVKCPTANGIVLNGYGGGILKCSVQILPQTGLKGISLANSGTGSARVINVTFNLSGIKYTQTAGTGLGKCTSGSFENGTYTGSGTLSASK